MSNVLYVDDEPALLDLGKAFLEMSGHLSVETATTVVDALDKIKFKKFDAIISDYQMPDMSGIEFLQHIRLKHHDIPFILFTGRGREEIVIEALNCGADFYLQKGGEQKAQFAELEHKVKNAIDRKRTHDALKESEQRVLDIINFLPDATFAVNLENKVIAWNKMIEEMTGISKAAILGTGDYSYAVPFYGEKRPILVDMVLNNDRSIEKKYPNLKRAGDKLMTEIWSPCLYDGKGAHIGITVSPLYDTNGSIIGAIEAIRDVTERKEAEEKLKRTNDELQAAYEQLTAVEEELRSNYEELSRGEQLLRLSEERYRDVVEDQTEFICRFTPDGRLTFVNDAYCRYFGLDKAACIGGRHTVVIPPEDRAQMKQHLSAFSPENPVGTVEHRIVMPTGEVRWQRWSDRAIFDKDGRIIEYQSVGRDTTDKVTAEEILRRTNEELHAAYEQLTATEEELRQNYDELGKGQMELNAAYEQLTATEEELRQNYEELARGEQQLRLSEERYRNVVEDQTEFICRFAPDGTHLFVNDAYCRYFGKNREDIIDRHFTPDIPSEDRPLLKVHFALFSPAHPSHTIEHRIVMPSGEVRWQQWSDRAVFNEKGEVTEYQSVGRDITDRKRTEYALNEVNIKLNLLSSITRHDILNQLTVLQGYCGLIEGKTTDHMTREWILKATQASEVIRSQISFTQHYQDLGMQKPLWQDLSLTAMIVCQNNGFSQVSIDEKLAGVEVFADPLLKTVFYHLFENAVMHGGGKMTRITVHGTATPSNFTLVVEDDGDGISPGNKKGIFEKGFGKHTGLGLYLVREVLSITGLTIEETGEPGKGARFEIRVPPEMYHKPF